MEVELAPGKYVLAVSGGVDSMVLLDLLARKPRVEIVVAHFDHGIRPDSGKDTLFVEKAAKDYNFPFETGEGRLGSEASEAQARAARYKFLESVRRKHKAQAIITAHHQDDLLETALINILRGTGPRGLVAIQNNSQIIRPLLGFTKAEISMYAKKQHLKWREDSTNAEDNYLRNYLRHKIIPKIDEKQREQILGNIDKVAKVGIDQDRIFAILSRQLLKNQQINRLGYISLPGVVGKETLVQLLRQLDIGDFDRKTIERLDMALRTAKAGTVVNVVGSTNLNIGKDVASFSLA